MPDKYDPIDILDLYTKKIINREKQKQLFKKDIPELWLKKMKANKRKNNKRNRKKSN
jgi:hypothetical protein